MGVSECVAVTTFLQVSIKMAKQKYQKTVDYI